MFDINAYLKERTPVSTTKQTQTQPLGSGSFDINKYLGVNTQTKTSIETPKIDTSKPTINYADEGREETAKLSKSARKEQTSLYKEQAKEIATRQAEISRSDINKIAPEFESMSLWDRFLNYGLSTKGVDTMLGNLESMPVQERNTIFTNVYKQFESQRVTSPTIAGLLQGASMNLSERASQKIADTLIDLDITEENLYMGDVMRELSSFQSSEMWGRMYTRGLTYMTLGNLVTNLKPIKKLTDVVQLSSAASNLSTPMGAIGSNIFTSSGLIQAGFVKGVNAMLPVMIAESAKDVVLGAPINYIRGRALGLEGEELYEYLGDELVQDIIWNAALFGVGKAGKLALNTKLGVRMVDILKEGEVKTSDIIDALSNKMSIPKFRLKYAADKVLNNTLAEHYGGEEGIRLATRELQPVAVSIRPAKQMLDAEGNPLDFISNIKKVTNVGKEFEVNPTKTMTKIESLSEKVSKLRKQYNDAKFQRKSISEMKADTLEMKIYKKELRQELADAKVQKFSTPKADANKPYFVKGDVIELDGAEVKITDIRFEGKGSEGFFVYDMEMPNGSFLSQRSVEFEQAFRGNDGVLRLKQGQSVEYTATERSLKKQIESWKARLKQAKESTASLKEKDALVLQIQKEIDEVDSVIDLLDFKNKLDKEKLKSFYKLQQKDLNFAGYKLAKAENELNKAMNQYRTEERKAWAKLKSKSPKLTDELRETVDDTTKGLNLKSNKLSEKKIKSIMSLNDMVEQSGIDGKTPYQTEKIREYIKQNVTDPDFKLPANIEATLEQLNQKQFSKLDFDELRDMTELRKFIEYVDKTDGKMISREQWRDIQTAVMEFTTNKSALTKAMDAAENPIQGAMRWMAHSAYVRPSTVARRMFGDSPQASQLFKELYNSDLKRLGIQQNAETMLTNSYARANITNSKELKKLRSVSDTFDLANGKLKLTKMEQAYIYLASKNDDTFKDLLAGVRTSSGKKSIKLTADEIKRIADGIEFDPKNVKTKVIANDIMTWLNTEAKEIGNEASNILDGFSILTRDNYIFSMADSAEMDRNIGYMIQKRTAEGQGFLKEKVKYGKPIVIPDLIDGFINYERGLSLYAGHAKPMRNFKAFIGNADVRKTMNANYGENVGKYFENLIKDMETVNAPQFVDKLITRAVKNNISANLKVIMNQGVSYITAASEIDPKYLADVRIPDQQLKQIMTDNTPLYWARKRGFNRELADFYEQFSRNDLGVQGIKGMDAFTVEKIWMGLENETKDLRPELQWRSAEFNKVVAERWNDVIRKTQPMYSMLDRPELLRNKNPIVRLASVYSTQRAQNYSIMYEAIMDGIEGNKGLMAKKMSSVALSSFALAQINGLRKRMLGQPEDEISITKEFGNVMLGYVPIIPVLTSMWTTGYDMDNALEGFLNRSTKNIGRIGEELFKQEETTNLNTIIRLGTFEISKWFFDIPFENLEREVKIAMRIASPVSLYNYEKAFKPLDDKGRPKIANKEFYDNFEKAAKSGNEEYAFAVLDDMVSYGVSYDAFKQSMINRGVPAEQVLPLIEKWKARKSNN